MSSSTSGVSTGGITVDTFNGTSSYSSSFQQVLTRAVAIASLPIQQEQVNVNTLTGQQSTYASLAATFGQLMDAIQSVGQAQTGVSATSSDTSVVTASASSTAMPGAYTVEVDNIGSPATALSNTGTPPVTDPTSQNIDSTSSYTLSVNGNTTTITPTGSTLDDLVTAINNANAGVEAAVVNVGGDSGADYRLALTTTDLGTIPIQLTDSNGNPLMNQVAPGAPVQYSVNGSTEITGDSQTITLAPGLTANLVSQDPGSPVTITVGEDDSGLAEALSNFATAYNSAATAITGQTGQNGGALEGQSIVFMMENVLSGLSQYTNGSGAVNSLASLGLTVDETGQMSFDETTFDALDPTDVANFLGGVTSGGFLENANNQVDSLTDPTTGDFTTSINTIQDQINNINSEISDQTTQVNDMQQNLMTQLSAADATIATLQSQVSFFTQLFQTENANSFATGG